MGDADGSSAVAPPPPPDKSESLSTEETTKKLKLTDSEDCAAENNNRNDKPPDDPVKKDETEDMPKFPVTVMYNKNPLSLQISPAMTVLQLKELVKERTGVDIHLQKVLLKGIAKDDAILKTLGVSESTKKILVIGSSIEDVLKVKEVPVTADEKGGEKGGADGGSNWCSMQNHKKIIDKVWKSGTNKYFSYSCNPR